MLPGERFDRLLVWICGADWREVFMGTNAGSDAVLDLVFPIAEHPRAATLPDGASLHYPMVSQNGTQRSVFYLKYNTNGSLSSSFVIGRSRVQVPPSAPVSSALSSAYFVLSRDRL